MKIASSFFVIKVCLSSKLGGPLAHKKTGTDWFLIFFVLVGMTRFELATSGPPDRCATGLRHIPLS